jgi:hypothetical protein
MNLIQASEVGKTVRFKVLRKQASLELSADVVELMGRVAFEGFVPGGDQTGSKAQPEMWKEQPKFKQLTQAMQADEDTVFTVHLLFAETQRYERFELTYAEAEANVAEILSRAESEESFPTPCDYCGWCASRLTCPALTAQAKRALDGYSDDEKIKQWHPSKMETPEEIAAALTVWRKVLKGWGESVEFHALEAVRKRGLELPGYKLATESGGQYISDVAAAYAALALPQEVFLSACEPRMNTSKKYPDRVGLIDLFATAHGAKPAKAKKEVLARLCDALKDKAPKVYLKAAKATEDEE